eukprot:360322-Chlamydomonas_euryale.AAC.4
MWGWRRRAVGADARLGVWETSCTHVRGVASGVWRPVASMCGYGAGVWQPAAGPRTVGCASLWQALVSSGRLHGYLPLSLS